MLGMISLAPTKKSLVLGSGGGRAALAGMGVVLLLHHAGIDDFDSIGGASAGSIISGVLAGGMHPVDAAHLTMHTEFQNLFTRRRNRMKLFLTYLLKDSVYRVFRPRIGLYGSSGLGEFMNRHVPLWPDKYWTIAVTGSSQVIFTKEGVFLYTKCGQRTVLSEEPPDVGFAVECSAAIPGIFDGKQYQGMWLYDGALSIDGRTPVAAIGRHLGVVPGTVIAVDVGDDNTRGGLLRRLTHYVFWKLVCGFHCPIEGHYPIRSEGTILIKPDPSTIPSLKFKLDAETKWKVIMSGFTAAAVSLEKAGLLTGTALDTAKEIVETHEGVRRLITDPAEVARETERLMKRHRLY